MLFQNKYTLFSITWLFVVNANAQFTWEKNIYDISTSTLNLQMTDMDIKYDSVNNKYVFLGMSYNTGGVTSVYELTGDSGNLVLRNYFDSNLGGTISPNLKFTSDSGIIISNLEVYANNVIKTLFKLDSNYSIVWKYQYEQNLSGSSQVGLKETNDHSLIMAGSTKFLVTNYTHPFLFKMDPLGGIIWSKVFKDLNGVTKFADQMVDGNYLIGINSYDGLGTVLVKTDTSGSVLWSKSYLNPNGYMYDLVIKPTGNLIIIGNTDSAFQTPIQKMFVMELDTAGEVLWSKVYGDNVNNLAFFPISFGTPTPPIKIIQTNDGGYAITTGIITPSNPICAAVLKIDSTGNVQWERRYGAASIGVVGIDLMQTYDNGLFVVCSWTTGNWFENGYYILKTDSLGHVAGCIDYSDSIMQASVFLTDSSITVTDSLITINRYMANVHDSIYPPPTVLDACVPVGFEEHEFNSSEILIYPNPSSGIFHFQQKTNDVIEKVEVFNCIGQRVFYKEGNVSAIDLIGNQQGIYFYLLKTKQGKSRSGKIIKE